MVKIIQVADDGTELYYLSSQQEIMAVPIERKSSSLSFGAHVACNRMSNASGAG